MNHPWSCRLHFGIGKNTMADSIKIIWPDGTQQKEI